MGESLSKALAIIISIAHPDKVILFGSRARGNAGTDSDYDLLVLKKGVVNRRELAQLIYMNFHNIGAPVDVIVNDPNEYEVLKNNPYLIYHSISEEGIIIYEKE